MGFGEPMTSRQHYLWRLSQLADVQVLAILYEAKDGAENPDLLSCVENELGLRKFLEEQGHEYVVTADKDGDNSEMEKQLQDATIFISTPFHPGYLTR